MIIFGDDLISHKILEKISNIDDIKSTKTNSILYFKYDKKILNHCAKNSLDCAVYVDNIKQAIYSNAFFAKYIICDKNISKSIQSIAENYIFDSKVLAIIENENEIESIAINGIDGVIFEDILSK